MKFFCNFYLRIIVQKKLRTKTKYKLCFLFPDILKLSTTVKILKDEKNMTRIFLKRQFQ